MTKAFEIRECKSLEELALCVDLQRDVFALPEIELSPVRHLIVTINAGGFVLGAFSKGDLIGFVLSVPAFLRGEKAFYSHMTAVRADYQSHGVGAKLKWAQRTKALELGIKYIKWTFEPVKARNAYFNLEKLGAIVCEYQENFYGVDYTAAVEVAGEKIGLASDRLFAEWHLESPKVGVLAEGGKWTEPRQFVAAVEIVNDWTGLVRADASAALSEQLRIRGEFEAEMDKGLIARGFERDESRPKYLFYEK